MTNRLLWIIVKVLLIMVDAQIFPHRAEFHGNQLNEIQDYINSIREEVF